MTPRPYVYKITHKITSQFYIGVRTANSVSAAEDLGVCYFTSSKVVNEMGFENFNLEIIAEFFKPEDALEFEKDMIRESWKSDLILNRNCSGAIFGMKGKFTDEHRANISKAQTGKKRKYSPRPSMSEYNRNTREYHWSDEARAKQSIAHTGKSVSEETRKKLSEALDGHDVSQETRDKISEANKGKPAWNKGLSNEWCKKPRSEETKRKISEGHRRRRELREQTSS